MENKLTLLKSVMKPVRPSKFLCTQPYSAQKHPVPQSLKQFLFFTAITSPFGPRNLPWTGQEDTGLLDFKFEKL